MDLGTETVCTRIDGIPKYTVWALDNTTPDDQERNVPDVVLRGVWHRMVQTGAARAFFHEMDDPTEENWLCFLKRPGNMVIFIVDRDAQDVCLVAVLNNAKHGSVQGHFCPVGPYKRGAGTAVLDFWSDIKDEAGRHMVKVVWGTTPATADRVVRLIRLLGFTVLGTIPHMFRTRDGADEGAVISFLDMEGYRNGRLLKTA
jgi:hypothetical protein